MLLAYRILQEVADDRAPRAGCASPNSYFLGSDLFYTFMSINNLVHWNDQKYKPEDADARGLPRDRSGIS